MFRQGTAFRYLTALSIAGILACCSAAGAAPPPKNLWATVNICNTVDHPYQMGVRASMPGNGRRQRMYMRFHAQVYKPATKTWKNVRGIGVSGWQALGSARRGKPVQAGYTFTFEPPKIGTSFVLRGVVDFQWREKRRTKSGVRRTVVVRTLHANTKGEHPAEGADPTGYSSGTCEIG